MTTSLQESSAKDSPAQLSRLEKAGRWWRRQVVTRIANLRLAIAMLLVIAFFSIAGTVIEQGQNPAYYQSNYPEHPALFGFLTWKVIQVVGLDHVYRTWWYLGLLAFFGVSLATCTFSTQLPMLKSARRWRFYDQPRFFEKLALSAKLEQVDLAVVKEALIDKKYRIFEEGDKIYARKGIIGKIGPIVVHAGMIIVLIGGVIGALSGFIAQEMVPSETTFQVKNVIEAGPWSAGQVPKDYSIAVKDFHIDYSPAGDIDQFYSDLQVLDKATGQELKRETIYVNKPLIYKGTTYYQTDWGISGVRVKINNSPVFQLPMAQLGTEKARIWGTWIPTKPDLSAGVSLLAKDMQGTVLLYDTTGQLVGSAREGGSIEVNGVNLQVLKLIGSTGLQIKADPGVPVVYLGFGLLMAGVVMSYFSHSQVWVARKDTEVYIGGRTNRAQVTFERELIAIIESFQVTAPVTIAPELEKQLS
jgi:cytochrome c biogenesis protein